MKKIGIIIAMQKELEFYANFLNNFNMKEINHYMFYCGTINDKELIIATAGIGKVNSALCTSCLINNFHPDIIITIGISGGLDENLNIGEMASQFWLQLFMEFGYFSVHFSVTRSRASKAFSSVGA